MKTFNDGNVQIQYGDENEPCVLELMNQIIIAYETIINLFKINNYDRNITIYLYNSVEELQHEVFGEKLNDDEVIIEDAEGNLKMVSPLNAGEKYSYSDIMKLAQKAVADKIITDNYDDIPNWLDITTYLFGLNDAKSTYTYNHLNINKLSGTEDAYFITLSLINIYGINKIIKVYKKSKYYNRILHASDSEINNKIVEYYEAAV